MSAVNAGPAVDDMWLRIMVIVSTEPFRLEHMPCCPLLPLSV